MNPKASYRNSYHKMKRASLQSLAYPSALYSLPFVVLAVLNILLIGILSLSMADRWQSGTTFRQNFVGQLDLDFAV